MEDSQAEIRELKRRLEEMLARLSRLEQLAGIGGRLAVRKLRNRSARPAAWT